MPYADDDQRPVLTHWHLGDHVTVILIEQFAIYFMAIALLISWVFP